VLCVRGRRTQGKRPYRLFRRGMLGKVTEADGAEAILVLFSEARPKFVTQLDFSTPATSQRDTTGKTVSASFAPGSGTPGGIDPREERIEHSAGSPYESSWATGPSGFRLVTTMEDSCTLSKGARNLEFGCFARAAAEAAPCRRATFRVKETRRHDRWPPLSSSVSIRPGGRQPVLPLPDPLERWFLPGRSEHPNAGSRC